MFFETFGVSHQTKYIYIETKFASHKHHLFSLLKTQADQSIPHIFYFARKETTHKPSNVTAAKTLLSSVYVIGTTCFDECFLFYVTTGRHYFS